MDPFTSSLPQSSETPAGPSIAVYRVLNALLLLISAIFLCFHFFHLSADFPNNSPWMDWAKYTDEGWYGDAAIRHFLRGYWYVPGDFNPAVALPVWPLLEALVFRFTGVSLVAARALTVGIFAGILLACYGLVQRWHNLTHPPSERPTLAPSLTVALLVLSPFCFAFTRLAILEPLLILLTLLALLAASYAFPTSSSTRLRRSLPLVALGLLFPLMVLTKTTAVFLLPSIAWLLYARSGYRLRTFLRAALLPAILSISLWLAYFGLIVRPHFLEDYHYLFDANSYTGLTFSNALTLLSNAFTDGLWIGRLLYPLGLLCAVLTVTIFGRLHRNPLLVSLLLWTSGYLVFVIGHGNLQPRYYLLMAIPITMLVVIVLEDLWLRPSFLFDPSFRRSSPGSFLHHASSFAAAALLLAVAISDGRRTVGFVRNPQYTFIQAASAIRQVIAADASHNQLVLSISGSDLSLMTGLPSICDDFGTMELAERIKTYRPGWYVSWNQIDDDKMDALATIYHLERIAVFPVMDDPDRNLLILYRLDPTDNPSPQANSSPAPDSHRPAA